MSLGQPQVLRLVALAAFASMVSMRICDPMLGVLGEQFSVSTGEASRVVSAFAVAYGLLQLFYGPLGDRVGKLLVVTSAATACSVLNALTALAPGFELLVAGRALSGAAAAGIIPLSMAWIGDQVAYDRRQETLARLMGATVMGMMVGQWFGGYAAQVLGWRVAFGVLSVLFAVAAWRLWSQGQGLRQGASSQAMTFAGSLRRTAGLLGQSRVRWVLLVTGIEGALAFGTLAFVPNHLVRHFGLSVSMAGAVMVLYGVGGLLYSVWARRWLAALGERGLALLGGTLICMGQLLLAGTVHPAWAMVACLLAGLGFYMLHNTLQTQATQMAPEQRGTAVTLFACVLFFGQSLGVLGVAQGVDRDLLSQTFLGSAISILLLAVLISRRVAPRAAPALG